MMTFYLVRHGETELNKAGIVMGQGDSPLTTEGIQDAHIIGKCLKFVPFDAVYSSDLGRAEQTAEIIREYISEAKEMILTPALREINYGKYNNTPRYILKQQVSGYGSDVSLQYPEGESLLSMQKRVCNFILELEKQQGNKTILLVSHSAAIKGVISYFTNTPLQAFYVSKREITHHYIGRFIVVNGSLVEYTEELEHNPKNRS